MSYSEPYVFEFITIAIVCSIFGAITAVACYIAQHSDKDRSDSTPIQSAEKMLLLDMTP